MLLHHGKEPDDDLGAGSDEDLALAALLSVDDVVEAIGLRHGQQRVSTPGPPLERAGKEDFARGQTHA